MIMIIEFAQVHHLIHKRTSAGNLSIMGDNARQTWEWHNNEIGIGYQARGVVRQPMAARNTTIVDLSLPAASIEQVNESQNDNKKNKKSIDESSGKKKKKKKKYERPSFNPLLQVLATRLSDKTMTFS